MNLKCSPTPLQHQNDRPRGGCGAAAAASEVFLVPGQTWPASLTSSEISGRLRSFPGTRQDLAGVPDGLCRGKEVFLVPGKTWPASLMPSEASETFSGVF